MGRASVDILECWVIVRGLLTKGIQLYGPFDTFDQAQEYGNKNFPEDSREFTIMRKEVTTHGGG